jgi:hypothetical protein
VKAAVRRHRETPVGLIEDAPRVPGGGPSLGSPGLDSDSRKGLRALADTRTAMREELLLVREAVAECLFSGLGAMAGPARSAVTPVGLIRRTRRDRRGERSAKMLTRRGKGEYKNSGCAR